MNESAPLIIAMQQRFLADWRAAGDHAPTPADAAGFWAAAGGIGLLGALGPESAGGLGEDADFAFEFLRQWGEYAAPGPLIATLVGGSALLPGTPFEPLLDGIADGSVRVALPTVFPADGASDGIVAREDADGFLLDGHVSILRDAPFATHIIFFANAAPPAGEDVLLCVAADALPRFGPCFPLLDGAQAAGLRLSAAPVPRGSLLARGVAAESRWRAARDRMTAAVCCEGVGILRAMLEQTVDYVRQRRQFGKAIGSFQVVQHRMAEMLVEVELAHSLALAALSRPETGMLASAAKIRINRALRNVADQAVQLHGGIGTTQELALSRYFRRATAIQREFGTTASHYPRVENMLAARLAIPAVPAVQAMVR